MKELSPSPTDTAPMAPLPAEWKWVQVGEVCELRVETIDPRKSPAKEFVYIDISSVDRQAKEIRSPNRIRGAAAPSRARQIVRPGDVLVATTRPNLNAVALVASDLDGQVCSTGFCVLRAKDCVISEYLFAFVKSRRFVEAVSDMVKGALYPAITDTQVRSVWMPLPPAPEQRRIAARLAEQLAAVERARAAVEEQLVQINKLPAAFLEQAFNGDL